MVITEEVLESVKSLRGGYTRAILNVLGVAWPPRHGWRKRLVGTTVPDDAFIHDQINPSRLKINPHYHPSDEAVDEMMERIKASKRELRLKRRAKRAELHAKRLQFNNDGKEYSYIVGALTTKFVKIGKTSGPIERRLAALQTSCPHKLVVLGTSDVPEASLHYRFRKYRVDGGEWFLWSDELKHFISYECHPVKPWKT